MGYGDDDLRGLTLSEGTRHGRRDETREDVSKLVARGECCQWQLLTRLELEFIKISQDGLSFGKELSANTRVSTSRRKKKRKTDIKQTTGPIAGIFDMRYFGGGRAELEWLCLEPS